MLRVAILIDMKLKDEQLQAFAQCRLLEAIDLSDNLGPPWLTVGGLRDAAQSWTRLHQVFLSNVLRDVGVDYIVDCMTAFVHAPSLKEIDVRSGNVNEHLRDRHHLVPPFSDGPVVIRLSRDDHS
jgi:hypothetical protein